MSTENGREYFPLSLSQQNILGLERSLSGTSVNNISTTVKIRGRLDFAVLEKSINAIIESDSTLRTRLCSTPEGVMQYRVPFEKEDIPVYDFTNTSADGIENWECAVTREAIFAEDAPLYRFVLFRASEDVGGILVKLHHIIADGWSQIMLCNKIAKLYLELLSGNDGASVEISPDYRLHIQEENDYLASPAYKKDERYWRRMVASSGEPSCLKSVTGATVSPVGKRLSFDLPQVINHAIFSYCQEKRVAPFAVFYMALAIYFKRNGGDDRFTVGVPIFNRTSHTFKQSTGMFVTTLPFFNELCDEWTLNEFNDDLAEKWFELLKHQRYPFAEICNLAGNDGRLFNIALSYQDSKMYESRDASVMLNGRWHYCGYQAEQLTIHLTNLKNHQQYAVDYDFLAQFFTEEEITALHRGICHILVEALGDPDKPIHKLNVLSLEEKEKVLYSFNDTDRYLEDVSVFEALIKTSRRYLNRVALIHRGERVTYGALLHRAAQFAEAMGEEAEREDALAAILLPRSAELFAAMVGAVQQDCPYMLLSDTLPAERIKTILEKSKATVLITDKEGKRRLSGVSVPTVCTEDADECYGIPMRKCPECGCSTGDRLAYVVYTSGSTGEPKGVEITQRNLLNLSQEMTDVYGQGAVLSVCNVGFDAFMLESMVALLNGRTIVLPEDSELESAERLASLINGYAVGFISLTPSRLAAFLRVDAFKNVMWRLESIVCGGEAFPHELLKKLKECTMARIYNQYGPSETTVAVSMKELSHADKITVGSPMGNCKMYVLDKHMNPLPIGGNGRLFVGGKCVGRGYRNRPDLTAASFKPNPFIHEDTVYDTGDVASWTPTGEIVLSGRADRQIKLRGLRIELQEVSSCIESHPDVAAAHAAVRVINGQQVLGVYYVAERDVDDSELISYAATYLPGYMIPSFLLRVDSFPFTANGKIDENALPMPALSDAGDDMTPSGEKVLEIFKKVLRCDELEASHDYFLAGGNSLNAMETLIDLEKAFGRRLRVADLYVYRTAAKLGAFLDGVSGSRISVDKSPVRPTLKKAEKRERYPLTPLQQGMYVQSVLSPDSLSYNMPGALKTRGKIEKTDIENAFRSLIAGDPIFRTEFVSEGGAVSALVRDHVDFDVEVIEAETQAEAEKRFMRPFDLSRAPLIRAALWNSSDGDVYLFVDSHHIIGDGLTTPVMLRRLNRALAGKNVTAAWNFYDYLESGDLKGSRDELDFWLKTLSSLPEPAVLPADNERQARFDFRGSELSLCFNEDESRRISEFCRNSGDTEYGVFLAAFALVVSLLSGKNDVIIGAPVSGRRLEESASICGPFINTLPLRMCRSEDMTVGQWLERARHAVVGMIDHQRTSLEEIISEMKLPRGEQNALYRVMLTQSPVSEDLFTLGDCKMTYVPVSTGSVKMDLILELSGDADSCYKMNFSYASSVFERETVALWSRYVKNAVLLMTGGDGTRLSELDLLSAEDRERLIDEVNYKVTPFVNRPVHRMLHSTAKKKENETAVIFHDREYTFGELEARASFIADYIEKSGIGDGAVAICMPRSFEMIAVMYGVLKAGCAYTFLKESFPPARLRYMLEASKARLVIVGEGITLDGSAVEGLDCPVVTVPDGVSVDSRGETPADGIANILFTSGSTGRPKGVMLKHRSVANLCGQMKTLLEDVPGRVLCSTNCVFDCFIVETVIALALGRCVVMADDEEMMLPWKLAALVEKYETSVFEMTPTRLRMCLDNEDFRRAARHIGIVLLGGEAVSRTLVEDFCSCSDGRLMNMYGPTEATVFTTMCQLLPGEHVTIGRPLQNTRTYVLDDGGRPVLPTACGEMYIAGECLSEGYASAPDQTAESFADDIVYAGERMYKSGDIVRLRADGRYDYIGRADEQIKLNGQRVELTEINGAMSAIETVLHAATVGVRRDGFMSLCAFYVSTGDISPAEITERLRLTLPPYMVPAKIVRLDAMPMTPTGKFDMMALRSLAESSDEPAQVSNPAQDAAVHGETAESAAPVKADEQYVLSVWNRVLDTKTDDADVSFFDLGGSSMAALNVLGHYYNDKLEMSLSDFYENPTARAQALKLGGGRPATPPDGGAPDGKGDGEDDGEDHCEDAAREAADPEAYDDADGSCEAVQGAVYSDAYDGNEDGDVLVTGATGFFGAHLTAYLVEHDSRRVICLVRDGSGKRLRERFEWYFGKERADALLDRVETVCGDVSEPYLGMTDEALLFLSSRIGYIYHCAADVRHYSPNEEGHMKVNVNGTREMLSLAKHSGAKFYHMSTCSVGGDVLRDGGAAEFTESDLDIGQVWDKNVYVKSKFLAERAVEEEMKNGVDAKIFRLGRLVGRETDGRFQPNAYTNMFYLIIQSLAALGAVPEDAANVPWDVMPVDMAAEQVVLLSRTDGKVFHIMNPDPPTLGQVFCAVDDSFKVVSSEEFAKAYGAKSSRMGTAKDALLKSYILSAPAAGDGVTVTCKQTQQALEKLGYSRKIRSLKTVMSGFGKEK